MSVLEICTAWSGKCCEDIGDIDVSSNGMNIVGEINITLNERITTFDAEKIITVWKFFMFVRGFYPDACMSITTTTVPGDEESLIKECDMIYIITKPTF
mgnify:CR=1 FL=1